MPPVGVTRRRISKRLDVPSDAAAENVAGVDRARSAGYRRAGGGAGAGFGGGAVGVEGEEAGEHFVADFVGPTPAVGLLLAAPGGFVDRVVEEQAAGGGNVAPAVGVEHGAVHGGVQLAQFGDARVGLVEVVKAVVGAGHAFVVVHHERGAVLVVLLACGFEGGMSVPAFREREGLEAVGGGVAQIILHRRAKEPRPDFVRPGLEGAECRVGLEREDDNGVGIDDPTRQECKRNSLAYS